MKKRYFKFTFSLIVGATLVYYTFQYVELQETLRAIHHARGGYLLGALVLLSVAHLSRGVRWKIWERHLRFWDSFKLILVGFMGNNVLPARLGEVLRAHCAADKTPTNYGRTAALASVVVERILDGFVIALIGIAGMAFVPIDRRLFLALMFVCAIFFVLSACLLLGIFFHTAIRAVLEKLANAYPKRLTIFGKDKANYFLDGLLLVRGFRRLALALLSTVVIWGIELLMYDLVANAVWRPVPLTTCLLFLAVLNFASLFPFTIGGIGAVEGAATMYLMGSGIPANESLAMVLLVHAFQLSFAVTLGGAFYFTSGYYSIPVFQSNPDRSSR